MAKCDYRVWIYGSPVVGSSALCVGNENDSPSLVSESELHVLVATYGRDAVSYQRDGE